MILRIDKYLADMGCGTRSQIKNDIRKGAVAVNGIEINRPETKVDTQNDTVCYRERTVSYAQHIYYMLNKPAGVISATEDRSERTVLDLISDKKRSGLFPVGRLDKDTEGLLIITDDGDLAHRLLSPKKHVDKVYYAKIQGKVDDTDKMKFLEGLDIGDDRPALPGILTILSDGDISEIELTIREGRFHQVKRMFHAVGKEVLFLKRIKMGSLSLDETLAPGEYRPLSEEEIALLYADTKATCGKELTC